MCATVLKTLGRQRQLGPCPSRAHAKQVNREMISIVSEEINRVTREPLGVYAGVTV